MSANPLKAVLREELNEKVAVAHRQNMPVLTLDQFADHLLSLHLGQYYRDCGYPVVVTFNEMYSYVHVILAEGNDDLIIDIPPNQRILVSFPADLTKPFPTNAGVMPLFE